jgi:hypothetical protein
VCTGAGNDALGCRRSVAERAVWPDSVVMPSSGLDQNLSLDQAEEDLAVEQLVTELAVEAFAVTVFPGAAGLDVGGLGADGRNPIA